MNKRVTAGLLGYLTLFTGAAMLPSFILAAMAGEIEGAAAFLLSMFLCVAVTFELERFGGLKGKDNIGVRDGIAITGLGWFLVSVLGTVPYFAGGYLNLIDSFVESFAGFSGTGATVIEKCFALAERFKLDRRTWNCRNFHGVAFSIRTRCNVYFASRIHRPDERKTNAENQRQREGNFQNLCRTYRNLCGELFFLRTEYFRRDKSCDDDDSDGRLRNL